MLQQLKGLNIYGGFPCDERADWVGLVGLMARAYMRLQDYIPIVI
jgi:hypothetical protein